MEEQKNDERKQVQKTVLPSTGNLHGLGKEGLH